MYEFIAQVVHTHSRCSSFCDNERARTRRALLLQITSDFGELS
jgi:hypothetical protein